MISTPMSLLEKLRRPDDHGAWAEFVELYTPLMLGWASRLGVRDGDAADLVQDVFVLLLRKMPGFVYDPQKSFRGWLRIVALNEWRARADRPALARLGDGVEAIEAPPQEAFWEAEYRQLLVQRAMELMQSEFEPSTWKACWETVVNDRTAPDVAADLGLRPGAIRAARFRVLNRLRQRLNGLME